MRLLVYSKSPRSSGGICKAMQALELKVQRLQERIFYLKKYFYIKFNKNNKIPIATLTFIADSVAQIIRHSRCPELYLLPNASSLKSPSVSALPLLESFLARIFVHSNPRLLQSSPAAILACCNPPPLQLSYARILLCASPPLRESSSARVLLSASPPWRGPLWHESSSGRIPGYRPNKRSVRYNIVGGGTIERVE